MLRSPSLREVPEQPTLAVRLEIAPEALPREIGPALERAMARALAEGAGPGAPFVRRIEVSPGRLVVDAGVCVSQPAAGDGRAVPGFLPAGWTACADHVGPYAGVPDAHRELVAWAEAEGHRVIAGSWEFHRTSPADVAGPEEDVVRIYVPIAEP